MRLESTPQRQREHNDEIHRHSRLMGTLAAMIIVAAVGLEASLYFGLRSQAAVPTVTGPDGRTVLGSAIVVTPDYAITTADVPAGSQLSISESDKVPVQRVRSESIAGVTLLLLRLQAQYPKEVPSMRAVQSGEIATATSLSGMWEGTLVEVSPKGSLEAQPAITIGDLAALSAKTDKALLGISAPSGKGDAAISVREMLATFPELKK